MTGYYFNQGSQTIEEIIVPDDGAFDDLILSDDWMVLTIQFDFDIEDDENVTANCEGGWQPNDFYCDAQCGENFNNSPCDCDQVNNKELYLRKVRLFEDSCDRNAPNTPDRIFWERGSVGRYEIGFSSWTYNTNGHYQAIKHRDLQKLLFENVLRVKIKKSGAKYYSGQSEWKDLKDRKTNEEAIISENYNPLRSTLYIFFYENDRLRRQKIWSNVPVIYAPSNITFDHLLWRGPRGNITSGKYRSTYWSFWPLSMSPTDMYNTILPNSNNWVDETLNGEDIKVYKNIFQTNNLIDYEIYYFKSKHGK